MSYQVRFTRAARDDLQRLYRYLIELDVTAARQALEALTKATRLLEDFPFSCRKASSGDPLIRELIVPFGNSGYVVLFEIEDSQTVTILAVRHQREDDLL